MPETSPLGLPKRHWCIMALVISIAVLSLIDSIRKFPSLLSPARQQQELSAALGIASESISAVGNQSKEEFSGNSQDVTPLSSRNQHHCPIPNMSIALSCLGKTPILATNLPLLTYPRDAHAHVIEIHQALDSWIRTSKPHCAANYCGPWIENHWMDHFINSTAVGSCLSATFGPFIPLLIPWVDLWVAHKSRYPPGFNDTLLSLLRPDVAYITVSQNDEGLVGSGDEIPLDRTRNILVLSAGGYGHVPVPLLKQEEPLLLPTQKKKENRTWFTSYVGSLGNAPRKMRRNMHKILKRSAQPYIQHYSTGSTGDEWHAIMADSFTSMAPRGFGRTSYHLMEILQSGLIPVHVYQDVPWVPYETLYQTERLGYMSTVWQLADILALLRNMTPSDFHKQEERIASYRQSHFIPTGVMEQIRLFMTNGGGDLECRSLPSSSRD